jgi:hypothetical protein
MEERDDVLALLSHVFNEKESLSCKHDVVDVFAVCQETSCSLTVGIIRRHREPLVPAAVAECV